MLKKYLPEEKVLPGPQADESDEIDDVSEKECFNLFKNAGIDPMIGLSYSQNDQDFYRTILSEYLLASRTRMSELEEYFAAKDWENYGILTHALKSTSKMIGAMDLSGMAAGMEEAAGAGDEEKIFTEHGDMMNKYRTVTDAIQTCLSEGDDTPEEPSSLEDDEVMEFLPDEW